MRAINLIALTGNGTVGLGHLHMNSRAMLLRLSIQDCKNHFEATKTIWKPRMYFAAQSYAALGPYSMRGLVRRYTSSPQFPPVMSSLIDQGVVRIRFMTYTCSNL